LSMPWNRHAMIGAPHGKVPEDPEKMLLVIDLPSAGRPTKVQIWPSRVWRKV